MLARAPASSDSTTSDGSRDTERWRSCPAPLALTASAGSRSALVIAAVRCPDTAILHPDQHPGRADRPRRRSCRSATWRSRSSASRDARRFVLGFVVAAVGWFAILYPNIAALPLPSAVVNAYQGILPTYLYAFQFPVSTVDRSVPTAAADPDVRRPDRGASS